MTQPDKFDWATELSDAQGHVTLSKQEAKEIGARLRSMGAKIKTYEDLGDAGSDVQLLRMGYAAARLEIESLRKERADELAVAYMCGASREKELAAQQPDTAYAALPDGVATLCEYGGDVFTAAQMHDFADRTHALRASHGQAPAVEYLRTQITGMSVSVDVSTDDATAGHRYFGTVTEVMECQGDKHGITLLVQDAEPNFKAQPAPAAVAWPVVNRATVIEWLDANDIEVTDRQMDGLFHFAAPTTQPAQEGKS